ncbi:putative mitochondrial ribosomal protein L51 / S25 / CI-B8 domain [Lyophyllum shimeji]|uniref:Mitochondrial ribosomal protein L51 / S25 / CI-B8 domain n=1 Tax=Lyophyllum shimeji TaxID=47721 RepID=A0A9P3PJQ1_LYOSH|nr:putative mitochondrial ribosomal protein L51 / S25 / CI-B8 domain [Lyophyllum shimeji]
MSRLAKRAAAGPSHLARVLAHLNAPPKLELSNLKTLRLSLAFRNDHFGARHFVKDQLPRIRYANPNLDIQVEKVRKTPQEAWRPEMELEFTDGKQKILDLHEKWSTTILKELMELAGGESWAKWKLEAAAAGLPLVPGEENEPRVVKRPTPTPLPSLKVFRGGQSASTEGNTDASTPPHPMRLGRWEYLPLYHNRSTVHFLCTKIILKDNLILDTLAKYPIDVLY